MILKPKDRIRLGTSLGTIIDSDELITNIRWDTDSESNPDSRYETNLLTLSPFFGVQAPPYKPGDILKLGAIFGKVIASNSDLTSMLWDIPSTHSHNQTTSFLREKATLEITSHTVPILPIDPEVEKEIDQLIASKSRPIRSIRKEREDIIAYLRKNGVRDYIIEGIAKEYHLNSSDTLDFSTYSSIQNFLSIWVRNSIITGYHKNVITLQLKKIFEEVPNLPMPQIGVTDEQDMVGFTWDTKHSHINIEIFKDGYLEFYHADLDSGSFWGEELTLEEDLSDSAIDRIKGLLYEE